MSTIATLADAVAAHVSAGSFGQPVTAVRMYQPAFTLEDLKDLRVSVVPRTVQMTPVTRDSLAIEYVIDIGVQKKLPADGADAGGALSSAVPSLLIGGVAWLKWRIKSRMARFATCAVCR